MPIGCQQIRVLGSFLEQFTSAEVRQMVMAGSEQVIDTCKPAEVAAWLSLAMERLEKAVDAPTRRQVLLACGRNCAAHNPRLIQSAVARRRRFPSLDAFLDAEQRNPPTGTLIERHGDRIIQYYIPRAFKTPMRCFCSLWRGLPAGQSVSRDYCQCSEGFVRVYWESVLEHPVDVELVESAISGAKRCQFVIHMI